MDCRATLAATEIFRSQRRPLCHVAQGLRAGAVLVRKTRHDAIAALTKAQKSAASVMGLSHTKAALN